MMFRAARHPSDPSVATDVRAAHRGDADAFTRLVQDHARTVCAVTTAVLGDPAAGEEVAQEVFVEAWQALSSLRDPDSFPAWIRQIARHRASNARRTRFRRREVTGYGALDGLRDTAPEPDERLDAARREAALWRSLDALDVDDREVLILFHREGCSVRQVADLLGLQEPTVRKRLSRARDRLRSDVEEALAPALARSGPGAAFVVAVVAAIAALAPAPARAAGPWRPAPRRAVATAGLLGGLVGALLTTSLPCVAGLGGPGTAGPRPSETRAALRRNRPPSVPTVPDVLPPQAAESLRVRLGTWTSPRDLGRVIVMFQPATFWPTLDEAPFPSGKRVAALVDHVAEKHYAAPEQILERIGPLRTDTLPDDPWGALVAMEVERLYAVKQWHDALPDPQAARSRRVAGEPVPEVDLERVLTLATRARERWPEHPVADYAAVYELRALGDGRTADPVMLGEAAMELLESSSDPYVLDAAVTELAGAGTAARLTAADLDLLQAHYDDPEADIPRYPVALLGVDTALSLGDLSRAGAWMSRHDRSTAATAAGGEISGDDPNGALRRLFEGRDLRSGWLAALGVAAPVNWQSGLYAVAHRCHAEGHEVTGERTGEGRYDGTWQWSWPVEDGWTACVSRATPDGPAPPSGTRVTFDVLPP